VLRARGLTVKRGGREVVHDLDLEVARGEVVVLLGPNGAGKSTLLAALAGLIAPSRGDVEHDGRVAAALQAPAMARRSVRANVEAALAWWGVPRDERGARATTALARLRADHLAERHAATLSGGEARRVHLARALSVESPNLLLDEPFAGLDPATRADLLYDAASVLRDPGRAVLVIVHDRAEAWALADRVAVLLDGRIEALGPPSEVLDRPPTRRVAEFVGFTGWVQDGDGVRLTRPTQVVLDPAGEHRGTVSRRVPVEDGIRIEVELEHGHLVAIGTPPGPEPGTTVRLRVVGGVRFGRAAGAAPWTTPSASEPSPPPSG
jgi:ABC-type sulfate/molybdate transport systems ATPase subunit